jgi:ParB-like chromosome segregation protein Spo0J
MIAVKETRKVKLGDLTSLREGLGNNPRRGDIDFLMRSIKAHGQFRAALVRESDMVVLIGNHMIAALERLALAGECETDADGDPVALCNLIDCDDVEAKRIALADNRGSELGSNNDDELQEYLRDLAAQGVDLEDDGYDEAQLLELLSDDDGDDGADTGPALGDVEYRILVFCSDEHHQAALLEKFELEGLKTQALAQ